MTMHPAPPAGTIPHAGATNHDSCFGGRHHASRRLRIRHTLSGLAHQFRFHNQPNPHQMMSTLGSQLNAFIHHQSYERIENRRPEAAGGAERSQASSSAVVRAEVTRQPQPQLTIVPFDDTQQDEQTQSPEQELSRLTEKTLLDARCLCLKQLRKLAAEDRRAEAALQGPSGDKTQKNESEKEVADRKDAIRRWQSRVRVAEAELSRRGLAPPRTSAQSSADPEDSPSECPDD